MKITNFNQLIEHQFADLYSAEQQLVEVLPKLAEAATDPMLQEGFENHLEQTEQHVIRVEAAAKVCEMELKKVECKGMAGLVAEGTEILKSVTEGPLLDAALIGAAQRVEHYEIAAYSCLIAQLTEAGFDEAATILSETLHEEEETSEQLTAVGEGVNPSAASVE